MRNSFGDYRRGIFIKKGESIADPIENDLHRGRGRGGGREEGCERIRFQSILDEIGESEEIQVEKGFGRRRRGVGGLQLGELEERILHPGEKIPQVSFRER